MAAPPATPPDGELATRESARKTTIWLRLDVRNSAAHLKCVIMMGSPELGMGTKSSATRVFGKFDFSGI